MQDLIDSMLEKSTEPKRLVKMDPVAIGDLTTYLTPFLPYLVKAGAGAAEAAGKKFGADGWEQAKALWTRLQSNLESRPAAREAIDDVAANLDDEDALASLRMQIRKLLADDEALAGDVGKLWRDAKLAGVTVTASGDRSIAVGGSVSHSSVTTGDENVEQRS